jgi:hypothetical protein
MVLPTRMKDASSVYSRRLFTTVQQSFTNLVRDTPGKLQSPMDDQVGLVDCFNNKADKSRNVY